jgi:hypothetical protein
MLSFRIFFVTSWQVQFGVQQLFFTKMPQHLFFKKTAIYLLKSGQNSRKKSLTPRFYNQNELTTSSLKYVDKEQGCQIFLYTVYQNGGKYTKLPVCKLSNGQICTKWLYVIYSKWPKNVPTFPFQGTPKFTQKWDFWFEK